MCHGQILNQALSFAQTMRVCQQCGAHIPKGGEYYRHSIRRADPAIVQSATLCLTCAGYRAALDEDRVGCCTRVADFDRSDPTVIQRIVRGIDKLRRKLASAPSDSPLPRR